MGNNTKVDYWKLVDEGFLASWDERDAKIIKDFTLACHLGYVSDETGAKFFDNINNSIKRKWDDHKTPKVGNDGAL